MSLRLALGSGIARQAAVSLSPSRRAVRPIRCSLTGLHAPPLLRVRAETRRGGDDDGARARGARLQSSMAFAESPRAATYTTASSPEQEQKQEQRPGQRQRQRRRPALTLYTGTDCQLCDVAKAVLDEIRAGQDAPALTLQLYNIRDDALPDVHRWRRAYQYDIPVLHLDGVEIARHRLDRDDITAQIKEAANRADTD